VSEETHGPILKVEEEGKHGTKWFEIMVRDSQATNFFHYCIREN
jgi:hypothetical protein